MHLVPVVQAERRKREAVSPVDVPVLVLGRPIDHLRGGGGVFMYAHTQGTRLSFRLWIGGFLDSCRQGCNLGKIRADTYDGDCPYKAC